MPPMLIGHSQGGMQAVKILHVLTGDYSDAVPVWNPLTDFAERRTTIVDPLTGRRVAGGRRLQDRPTCRWWAPAARRSCCPTSGRMVGRLRTIPDTVEEFTGYCDRRSTCGRGPCPGVEASRATFENGGQVQRAQRDAAGRRTTTCSPGHRRPGRATRRSARGSTRTRPRRRCRRRPDAGTTCCGRPTSGTASRSTGCSRRSGSSAPGARGRAPAVAGKLE